MWQGGLFLSSTHFPPSVTPGIRLLFGGPMEGEEKRARVCFKQGTVSTLNILSNYHAYFLLLLEFMLSFQLVE